MNTSDLFILKIRWIDGAGRFGLRQRIETKARAHIDLRNASRMI
jgi:hypothetical protein